MPDTIPSSDGRTVIVNHYGPLTIVSLTLNAIILLLILIGICCHHHRHHHHHGWGGHHERQDCGGRGQGGFDRHDWQHHDGGPRDEDNAGPDHHGWDDKPGFGGPGPGPGPGDMHMPDHKPGMTFSADGMTDRIMMIMTQKLSLTDQQSTQVRPIVQQQIAQFQKDMEAEKAARQKSVDDAKTKVRAILNADQQKQFDQMSAAFGSAASPSK